MPLLVKYTFRLLGIWKIEESVGELLSLLENQEAYRTFIDNNKAESRKKEWLAARVLIKELFGKEEPVGYHPDGSPFLLSKPDYSISISHTKGYVAVYCVPGKPAGIDIEYRGGRVVKIKDKFMSPGELSRLDKEQEADHLLICWCAKETLFKLIREEGIDFRKHLHIKPFTYSKEGEVEVWESKTKQQGNFILSFSVTPEFVLTFNR